MDIRTATEIPPHSEKRTLVRQSARDLSQFFQRIVQWFFVALKGWLGVRF
jgi:hypothetical protein